tara:strand:+ start:97 stop:402 length:306 start_codon:yes stop_codon:yes gene_type:complete
LNLLARLTPTENVEFKLVKKLTSDKLKRASRRDNMKINNFNAVGIAEGFIECDDEEKIIEAWQYLIDTGLAFKLQGWFGRTAIDLIEQGICKNQQASEQKG